MTTSLLPPLSRNLRTAIHRRVMVSPSSPYGYDDWSREDLIARLSELERLHSKPKLHPPSPKARRNKTFNFSHHSRRKIALKFCYSGWEYGGLAFQNTKTVLPTVEGVLFDAMVKARLIDPEAGFEGCGWEKCGRTDRGVSAAGQVISLWVRSTLGPSSGEPINQLSEEAAICLPKTITADRSSSPSSINLEEPLTTHSNGETTIPGLEFGFDGDDLDVAPSNSSFQPLPSHQTKPEHDYLTMINRLLPPTIRILAWSPVSTSFSARFSCTHRHYKYFFSPTTIQGPGLDVDQMRTAASLLVGDHDFRNLCKLDPGKQITMFRRKVMRADIERVDDEAGDEIYVFNLIGSAFLYHQVRHIMAVLFMVGSGLEKPSVVTSLMNVEEGLEQNQLTLGPPPEVVSCKPEYQMADALPLILWDCGYPEGELSWRTTPSEDRCISRGNGNEKSAGTILYQQLHSIHSRSQIYTTLNRHFLMAASKFHLPPSLSSNHQTEQRSKYLIPLGGGSYKRTGQEKYVPLLKRNRLDSVETSNERWRLGKGFRREERRKTVEDADHDDGNE